MPENLGWRGPSAPAPLPGLQPLQTGPRWSGGLQMNLLNRWGRTPPDRTSVTWGQTWTSTPWASPCWSWLRPVRASPSQYSGRPTWQLVVMATPSGRQGLVHGGRASGCWVREQVGRQEDVVLARQGESREVRGPQEPRAQPEAMGAPHTGLPGIAVSSLACGQVLLEAPTWVPCSAPV